mgnify:CR=1 FL=1
MFFESLSGLFKLRLIIVFRKEWFLLFLSNEFDKIEVSWSIVLYTGWLWRDLRFVGYKSENEPFRCSFGSMVDEPYCYARLIGSYFTLGSETCLILCEFTLLYSFLNFYLFSSIDCLFLLSAILLWT